ISGDRRDTRHRSRTFLQHEAKFRGGKGKTVEVSGFPGAKTTKPKTRKETMKNQNIQFKAAALRCKIARLFLAFLAAAFISAPNPTSAGDQVPFNGTLAGCVETQEPIDQCTIHAHAALFGNATHLGAFTGTGEFYQNFCENPPNITYSGSFHFFCG